MDTCVAFYLLATVNGAAINTGVQIKKKLGHFGVWKGALSIIAPE